MLHQLQTISPPNVPKITKARLRASIHVLPPHWVATRSEPFGMATKVAAVDGSSSAHFYARRA
jgi:hypothetical protein